MTPIDMELTLPMKISMTVRSNNNTNSTAHQYHDYYYSSCLVLEDSLCCYYCSQHDSHKIMQYSFESVRYPTRNCSSIDIAHLECTQMLDKHLCLKQQLFAWSHQWGFLVRIKSQLYLQFSYMLACRFLDMHIEIQSQIDFSFRIMEQ